jgi:hypothetical protein
LIEAMPRKASPRLITLIWQIFFAGLLPADGWAASRTDDLAAKKIAHGEWIRGAPDQPRRTLKTRFRIRPSRLQVAAEKVADVVPLREASV